MKGFSVKAPVLLLLWASHRANCFDIGGFMKKSMMSGSSGPRSPVMVNPTSAPSWDELRERIGNTPTGSALRRALEERAAGAGPPHTDAKLRLFGTEGEPRVTLFRDTAAWCPYCQKVWIQLEEKQIPYRIEKINMRSYGDKPAWFLEKVPNGLLPAMELDGNFMTDSMRIMMTLEAAFPERPMVPADTAGRERANALLRLERELFGAWCQYCFRPGEGLGGQSKKYFQEVMKEVDEALGSTEGPWFLGGDSPSLVDLAYVTHIERMVASLLYWKGFQIRNAGYPNVDRWLEAFEQRPAYMATKSDYYTHVMDIPPQYGPGFFAAGAEDAQRRTVEGLDGSWALPLAPLGPGSFEPTASPAELGMGDEAARHHAAFQLASNAEAVVRFACRGAGGLPLGAKGFQAPLADPYCEPNLGYQPDVDALLRHVAYALLEGTSATENAAAADIASSCADDDAKAVAACAAYLRDRVGVPRDLPLPAARQLRAHLHWAAGLLLREEAGK